ncbi:hypothetical protein [Burkholderia sp. PR2]|uniref:hypothetical protein n=1 Tax=Burkholderia sp. PR2 TaxID=3448078 RepID=UPI00402AFF94
MSIVINAAANDIYALGLAVWSSIGGSRPVLAGGAKARDRVDRVVEMTGGSRPVADFRPSVIARAFSKATFQI